MVGVFPGEREESPHVRGVGTTFFQILVQQRDQVPFRTLAYSHGWYALLLVRI